MDERRFDALVRRLGAPGSRRVVLAGLAAQLGLGLAPKAAAGCARVGKKCQKSGDCCKGASCKRKKCVCKTGFEDCNGDGRCENLQTDPDNCGACDRPCGAVLTCCSGECVGILVDDANCGKCGHACSGDHPQCVQGTCCREDGSGCICSPRGFACNAQTCCLNGGVGACRANGTCP